MRQVKTISKETIKYILKIIYKITRSYCIWYKINFPERVIDWDRPADEWNDYDGNEWLNRIYRK